MNKHSAQFSQKGFSLIELMVGLVIGLLVTLAIMQVFSVFEGQKRSTSGSADAQTNGTIALMNIQRNIQMAGYGLPMPMATIGDSSLGCSAIGDFDFDGTGGGTATTNLFPIQITEGAGGTVSDTITVRYSTTAVGAVPVGIIDPNNATTSTGMTLVNNIGCGTEDNNYATTYASQYNLVLVKRGSTCGFTTISQKPTTDSATGVSKVRLSALPATFGGGLQIGDRVACMGDWQDYTFDIANDTLRLNGQPIVSEVVKLQAQYGISDTATSNQVTSWVTASSVGGVDWSAPSVAERNRIKAVRLAIVLRNGLKEKEDVTDAAPVAWVDSGTTSMAIDVTSVTDWQKYRYRVFTTAIPLRNMLWSREAL